MLRRFAAFESLSTDLDDSGLEAIIESGDLGEQVDLGLEITQELAALEAISYDEMNQLEVIFNKVAVEGLCQADYDNIEAILPGSLEHVNRQRLTVNPSIQQVDIALEGIDWRKAGIIATIAAAVIALLYKLVMWIKDKFSGGGDTDKLDKVVDTIDSAFKKVENNELLKSFSSAYDYQPPFKVGSHEANLFIKMRNKSAVEGLAEHPWMIELDLAMCRKMRTVNGPRNFRLEAVETNTDLLRWAIKREHMAPNPANAAHLLNYVIGAVEVDARFTPIAHYIISNKPEDCIFSEPAIKAVIEQYLSILKIAEGYMGAIKEIPQVFANVLYGPGTTGVTMNKLGQDMMYLTDATDEERNRFFSKLAESFKVYWDTFMQTEEGQAVVGYARLVSPNTVDLISYGNSAEKVKMPRQYENLKYSQVLKSNARGDKKVDYSDPQLPYGLTFTGSDPGNIFDVWTHLQQLQQQARPEDGMVFCLQEWSKEGGQGTETYNALVEKLSDPKHVGYYADREAVRTRLQSSAKAVKFGNDWMVSNQIEKRMETVTVALEEVLKGYEAWKNTLDISVIRMLNGTHSISGRDPRGNIFNRDFNLDSYVKGMTQSIQSCTQGLGRWATYLDGMEKNVKAAISTQAKVLKGHRSFSRSKEVKEFQKTISKVNKENK